MGGEGGSSLLLWSVAERVGETVGKEGEMGILACQQGPSLRKLSGGGSWGKGALACYQGPLLRELEKQVEERGEGGF